MPCLVVLIALIFPRLAIFLVWLFGDYLENAYLTFLWPFLGFIFMPYTTLAYAAAVNENGGVSGIWLLLLIFAVLADLSSNGSSAAAKKHKRR